MSAIPNNVLVMAEGRPRGILPCVSSFLYIYYFVLFLFSRQFSQDVG